MSSIPTIPSPPTTIQVVLEVVVLRDRIIDHLKWIEKLLYVCIVGVVYAVLMN
jgi:hypothetical protein